LHHWTQTELNWTQKKKKKNTLQGRSQAVNKRIRTRTKLEPRDRRD